MSPYIRSLESLADRYRLAEMKVVRAYFRKPRTTQEHIHWLRAQAFKEYSAIKPLVTALAKLHGHFDREVDRHRYEELGQKLVEEMKHARLIMDLLEEMTGRRVTPRDLVWLPEDRKLAEVRARYSKTYAGLLHGSETISARGITRKDEALERAAVTLTEGGGGALYEVCARLGRRGVGRKIGSVFQQIYRDEVRHKNAGARDLAGLVTGRRDYERAVRIMRNVLGQRLRMRNEQFGFPLSERELKRMERRIASGRFTNRAARGGRVKL